MLFGRRKRTIKRLLVVEDEPLVAFDNEHVLGDAGYEVVGTVDGVAAALRIIAEGDLDLVLTDISLSDEGSGIEVAQAARAADVPVLFVTGNCPMGARALAVGCLAKPYAPRELLAAIQAVDQLMQGETPRRIPGGLTFFDQPG
jgi:two-component system, response regulator PdtaR